MATRKIYYNKKAALLRQPQFHKYYFNQSGLCFFSFYHLRLWKYFFGNNAFAF